jgi:hypothetical protein
MELAGYVEEVSAPGSDGAETVPTRREVCAARRAEEQPDSPRSHADGERDTKPANANRRGDGEGYRPGTWVTD